MNGGWLGGLSRQRQVSELGVRRNHSNAAMQTEAAERRRRRPPGGSRRRASSRRPEEETDRLKDIIGKQKEQQTGSGEEDEEREKEQGRREGREGGGQRGPRRERSKRAESGGEEDNRSGGRRWRVHQLERERLELTSCHNQEVCQLQAQLTCLRSLVERGEAQRVELEYQLTLSQRDSARASELTERAAELQREVQEVRKTLEITRRSRDEDQHALQQEVEEHDTLIQSFSSENQRLHRLLQDQEEVLKESERRMVELQKEKDEEAEVNRRLSGELKYLAEREERSRREKEVMDQRVKSLEASVEAERAAHLESKFNSEIVQLRGRDLEAALAAERSGQQEAQRGLESLRAQLGEKEAALGRERERSGGAERGLQRLQKEYERCKSDLSVALETERRSTSDLTERLEEEKRQHNHTHTLLQQEAERRRDAEERLKSLRDALQQHNSTGTGPPAMHDGSRGPPADLAQLLEATLQGQRLRLEGAEQQVQDLRLENQTLQRLTSDQSRRLEESQQASLTLEEEVTRLRTESSDWSMLSRGLQAQLEREREKERERGEKEREREENQREKEREREETTSEIQKITDYYQKESKAHLSFLHLLYQHLLAGCVLLDQPHSMLGDFTWEELCEVVTEQVDQLTSDLRRADTKIAQLQSVCDQKSVCVRELQRSQEGVLSRLEESTRSQEEAWSRRHTHLQEELQLCRSQCDSLRGRASSLERRVSSLTSDVSRGRGESASFLAACALLGGALAHARRRLRALGQQKALLCRRLAEREVLEEEVRRLAQALGGEEEQDEEEEEGRRRRRRRAAAGRWRRAVCAVLAAGRCSALGRRTAVLFRLEAGECVTMATGKGREAERSGKDEVGGREGACARWLRSKSLSSLILSSMCDLQGALTHTGSAPPDLMTAARSALSRLLEGLPDQPDAAASEDSLIGRLRVGLIGRTPPRPNTKALVSTLQQHFLLFSQRLHSAEVERRSLRLEVANLKRGRRQEKELTCRTVPVKRFHSVCVELRQALSREQEAQALIQEQTEKLHELQLRVDAHSDTQRTLSLTCQSLTEARKEVSRKERSLRILGKHLLGVQRERRQLEDELSNVARRREYLIGSMAAAETTYSEVRDSLLQSRRSPSAPPRPPPLPMEHLDSSGAESIMGAPEVAACRSLLSSAAQLYHTCSSRIDWLQQEVSTYRGHVTALRGELQDVCLRDNLAYVPVAEFPESFPFADVGVPQRIPVSDLSKGLPVGLSPAPPGQSPAPPLSEPKMRERKATKKSQRRQEGDVGVPHVC
ncbi:coiled-coil domain-containing protein 171-like isoform X2 [Pungitius pungitius]|uniref:coiled-coil domain-containing protein 171-like isoform X2 n=1 Tax=Pungitius pungitius TaxID=134920 RepID=UPI002E14AEEF